MPSDISVQQNYRALLSALWTAVDIFFRQEREDYDETEEIRRYICARPKVDFHTLTLNLKLTTLKRKQNLVFMSPPFE